MDAALEIKRYSHLYISLLATFGTETLTDTLGSWSMGNLYFHILNQLVASSIKKLKKTFLFVKSYQSVVAVLLSLLNYADVIYIYGRIHSRVLVICFTA